MKKLMIIVAVAMSMVSIKAASIDWNVSGTSSEVGYTVYLLVATPGTYASVAELAAAAIDSASINRNGRTYDTTVRTVASEAITSASMKDAYFVIVKSGDATEYTYLKQDMSARVYDPANQEPSKGVFATTSAVILAGTTASFQTVPEPTSGLLMLLGLTGLALKRKRA